MGHGGWRGGSDAGLGAQTERLPPLRSRELRLLLRPLLVALTPLTFDAILIPVGALIRPLLIGPARTRLARIAFLVRRLLVVRHR